MAGSIEQVFLVLSILSFSCRIYGLQQVPCYFIFGDSLADNGNNNMLATTFKSNYPPYGIDFPGGPTGRFTNGRNMYDVIAQLLGFRNFIPPFATARGTIVLKGVDYASGGAGILNETGTQMGMIISMDQQLVNHRTTIRQITEILGGSSIAATNLLYKCIYTVGIGSNDFLLNYFMPQYFPSSQRYTLEQFVQILIDKYHQQLRTLYTYNARKVAVFALPAFGCTPMAISTYGTNGSLCVDRLNNAAYLFNQKLRPLIDQLNRDLSNAKFTLVNPELSRNELAQLGVRIFDRGCCPTSSVTGLCIEFSTPCSNRSEYEFWDSIHPAEIPDEAMAKVAYRAIAASYLSPF